MPVIFTQISKKPKMDFCATDIHQYFDYTKLPYHKDFEVDYEPWFTTKSWQYTLVNQK